MSKIGHYSHHKLVSIICQYIGKAHGRDGCFDLEIARAIVTAEEGSERSELVDLHSVTLSEAREIVSGGGDGETAIASGVQTIENSAVRVDNSPTVHFGSLAIGEDGELSISEPYGSLEIV